MARARQHFELGLRNYKMADYAAAIREFKRAYELSPAPELLFNIGQAYRLGGDCDTALRLYRNYLAEVPAPRNRAEVDTAITKCEEQQREGAARPSAAGTAPPPTPALPPPPTIAPAPAAPGPSPAQPSPTGASPSTSLQPPPAVAAPPSSVEPPPMQTTTPVGAAFTEPPAAPAGEVTAGGGFFDGPGRVLRIGGLAAGAVGVGLLTGGVLAGSRASSKADEVDRGLRTQGGVWSPALASADAAGRQAASRATVFYATGLVALAAGGALYWLGHRAAARAAVAVVPVPGGGAAASAGMAF